VERGEEDVAALPEGVLGAVAVVDVPVNDEDPVQTAGHGVGGGDGGVVDEAKPHAVSRRRVVTRWPDEGEGRLGPTVEHGVDGGDRRPGPEQCHLPGVAADEGVGIQGTATGQGQLLQAVEVGEVVDPLQRLQPARPEGHLGPSVGQARRGQRRLDGGDPARRLGVAARFVAEEGGRPQQRRPPFRLPGRGRGGVVHGRRV
jgi:hypothetical protein